MTDRYIFKVDESRRREIKRAHTERKILGVAKTFRVQFLACSPVCLALLLIKIISFRQWCISNALIILVAWTASIILGVVHNFVAMSIWNAEDTKICMTKNYLIQRCKNKNILIKYNNITKLDFVDNKNLLKVVSPDRIMYIYSYYQNYDKLCRLLKARVSENTDYVKSIRM